MTTDATTTVPPAAADGDYELEPPRVDGIFSFGIAEMIYLAECAGPEAAERARSAFRFDERFLDSELLTTASLSSLMARGFLVSEDGGETYLPAHMGRVMAIGISEATRWMTIVALGSESSDSVRILRGPNVALLIQQHAFGTFHVGYIESDERDVDAAWGVIESQLELSPKSTIGFIVEEPGKEPELLYVRPHIAEEGGEPAADQYDVARGKARDDEPKLLENNPLSAAQLDELFDELLPPIGGEAK